VVVVAGAAGRNRPRRLETAPVGLGARDVEERPALDPVMPAGKLAVVVPTYNERRNIERLIAGVLRSVGTATVIVVDDQSPDGTGAVLDRVATTDPRVVTIHRRPPRGYGQSSLEGLRHALSIGAERIVQMDADGSHDPAALPALIGATAAHHVVIGSRYVAGGRVANWPVQRRLLSRWANGYVRAITGMRVRDVTSGFRCWTRPVLDRLPLDRVRSEGYGFLVEMTFLAVRAGFSVGEVPITFTDRVEGLSKMSWKVVLESAWLPWRLVLRGRRAYSRSASGFPGRFERPGGLGGPRLGPPCQ
jgi:dolichol-phosphate mannosyltransferase